MPRSQESQPKSSLMQFFTKIFSRKKQPHVVVSSLGEAAKAQKRQQLNKKGKDKPYSHSQAFTNGGADTLPTPVNSAPPTNRANGLSNSRPSDSALYVNCNPNRSAVSDSTASPGLCKFGLADCDRSISSNISPSSTFVYNFVNGFCVYIWHSFFRSSLSRPLKPSPSAPHNVTESVLTKGPTIQVQKESSSSLTNIAPSSPQPLKTGVFEEVLAHEPNLGSRPSKPAIKGRALDFPLTDQSLHNHLFRSGQGPAPSWSSTAVNEEGQTNIANKSPTANIMSVSLTSFPSTTSTSRNVSPNIAQPVKTPPVQKGRSPVAKLVRSPRMAVPENESPKVVQLPPPKVVTIIPPPTQAPEDDDDSDEIDNKWASKVARNDSVAKLLNDGNQKQQRRPVVRQRKVQHDDDDDSDNSQVEDKKVGNRVAQAKKRFGANLERKISLRPTAAELEQRNILHTKSDEARRAEMEERKRILIRKLRFLFLTPFYFLFNFFSLSLCIIVSDPLSMSY